MKTKLSPVILAAVLIATIAGFRSMGGFAVVTVMKIPDAWITGKPLQLTWYVRQHGMTPLYGLHPTLEARSGSKVISGNTWSFEEDGQKGYRGTITFPERGDWQVTINSGFGKSKAVLVPWRVVDSVSPIRGTVEEYFPKLGITRFSEQERGRRMFASMGCVTCHTHRDVGITGEVSNAGPDLTGRSFPAEYLAKFLKNPSIKPSTNGNRMPSLGLRDKDIGPLIAFINGKRQVTSR